MILHSFLLAFSRWVAWFSFLVVVVGNDLRKAGDLSVSHNDDTIAVTQWWRIAEAVPTTRIRSGWDENSGKWRTSPSLEISELQKHSKKASSLQATSLSQRTLWTTLLPALCCEKMKFRDEISLIAPDDWRQNGVWTHGYFLLTLL